MEAARQPRTHLGDLVNDRPMTRSLFRPLALLIATLAFARLGTGRPPSRPPPMELPIFEADTSAIEADEHLQWSIPFRVENRFPVGMYLDSLFCDGAGPGSGRDRAERITRLDVSHVVAGSTASAGETFYMTYVAPAIAERARLTFRLVLSRADKSRTSLTTVVEAMPGPVSRDHPSQFLTVNGKRVEYVSSRPRATRCPACCSCTPSAATRGPCFGRRCAFRTCATRRCW
jgi:hypothetical protein